MQEMTEQVKVYRVGRLTILQIMGILATFGLMVEGVLRYFFA